MASNSPTQDASFLTLKEIMSHPRKQEVTTYHAINQNRANIVLNENLSDTDLPCFDKWANIHSFAEKHSKKHGFANTGFVRQKRHI
uniref:High affinity copper uptake protein 1-like n=1 Tax=Phallusia mammillata TaxID=59560 RepID=A0A6F9DT84_9ASCI|nr:high affinity copper uptake protein 1-like [Phallusia mammillata]